MKTYVKNSGLWKLAKALYVRSGGIWKPAKKGFIRNAGVWKPFFNGDPAAVSLLTSAFDNADLSTYSLAFGPTAADCLVVVGFGCRHTTPRTITGVTVAGIAATAVTELEGSGGTSAAMYVVEVPASTSGNAVVTLSGPAVRGSIGLWAITAYQSAAATDVKTAADTLNPSVTCTVQDGGVIVGVGYFSSAAAGTWSGITEDYDQTVEGPNGASGASGAFATGQNVVVTRSDTGTTEERLIVASFR